MSMPEAISPSYLRSDLFKVLDQVLETGRPVEIRRKGALLQISRMSHGRLDFLKPHPGAINGDPDDIAGMDWSAEWRGDLS